MKYFITTIILFISTLNIYGDENIRNNYSLIDSCINVVCNSMVSVINQNNYDTVAIDINKTNTTDLFIKHLYSNSEGILFTKRKSDKLPQLHITVYNCKIKYKTYSSDYDSINRIIDFEATAYLTTKEGQIINIDIPKNDYIDIVARKDISKVENENFNFTKAEIPEKENTVFEEIAQPLIVITGALITVILLFTVRSG